MADKRKTPDAAEAARRAKRAATIDLTATEVTPESAPESKPDSELEPKSEPKPDGDPPIWQPPADFPTPPMPLIGWLSTGSPFVMPTKSLVS